VLNSTSEEKDLQALECLRVGAANRGLLLALATRLAGNAEDGMDLYQQSLLDCHDAVQKLGFTGSNYKFYIMQAIKWLAVERSKERQRRAGLFVAVETAEQLDGATAPAPVEDALSVLAELMGPGNEFSWVRRKVLDVKNYLRGTFGQAYNSLDL
jgi:DNA-directed RNA polymerase specialized sigma24 family protein